MASDGDHTEVDQRIIPLAQIDSGDERFRITTRRDSADLQPSLQRLGLLAAPLVLPTENGFIIVSGFRRIAACRELMWDVIPARVLSRQTAEYECALRAIAENSTARSLNLIETSRALALLDRHAPDGRVPPADAAALGLTTHPGLASKLKTLCRLPAEVQTAVIAEAVSFPMACELGRLEPDLAVVFARLFSRLKTGLNKQREILTLVSEIALREQTDPGEVLRDPALTRVLEMEKADHNQQTRQIRRLLRRRRFPSLVAAEDRFQELRLRLKLGENLQLTPPRDFEGTRFGLTLSFQSLSEIESLRVKLDELTNHPDFKTLLTGKSDGFEKTQGS
jgi:ParB family transcriptional regulator, chromosome partitioning protein